MKSNLLQLIRPYRGWVLALILFTILSNGLNLLIPKLIGSGIDAYGEEALDLEVLSLKFGAAALLIFIFTYAQNIVQSYTSEKVARDLRQQLTEKISLHSYLAVQELTPARLLTNLTSDVDAVKLFISQAIVALASSLLLILGASVLLLSINWKLALATLAILPLMGGTFFFLFRKVKLLFIKAQQVIDWLNKVINESILGSALIRVFNAQAYETEKFIAANLNAKDTGLQILRIFSTMVPIVTLISNLAALMILILGGHFVMQGGMTLGDFAAFNSYLALLIFPIFMLGFVSNIYGRANASYQRISEVLSKETQEEKGKLNRTIEGAISVKNLTLSYGEKTILKNLNFSIKAGTKTAILGPTAAGKTQLLQLLIGLIKPNSGSIQIDGKPLEDYEKTSLHEQIGLVFQDSILFNLSLQENIAFSDTVKDADLEKAIQTAELKNFIKTLPEGLSTIVSERGTSLSGGQKQRIMLARALAVNPKILLLDDFTARVDTNTEKKILKNLAENYPNLTLISVTQKVGAIEEYDQILLLMEGEMLAQGTHMELIKSSPEYVQISESQRSTHNL
jgi:ATP-binding cassette subfamily B protein